MRNHLMQDGAIHHFGIGYVGQEEINRVGLWIIPCGMNAAALHFLTHALIRYLVKSRVGVNLHTQFLLPVKDMLCHNIVSGR